MAEKWTLDSAEKAQSSSAEIINFDLGNEVAGYFKINKQISVLSIELPAINNSSPSDLLSVFNDLENDGLPFHFIVTINLQEQFELGHQLPWIMQAWHILNNLRTADKITNFTILTNCAFTHHDTNVDQAISSLPDVLPIQWFLCTYSVLYPRPIERPRNNTVLFLPGKLHARRHKLSALVEILLNNKYKNNCMFGYTADQRYSNTELFGNSDLCYYSSLHSQLEFYMPGAVESPKLLQQLLEENEQDVDGAQTVFKQQNALGVLPVSTELYKSCAVELVAETTYPCGYKHITEKTWRPLLAGCPFIHLNPVQTLYLQSLGFRTFEHVADKQWEQRGWREYNPLRNGADLELISYGIISSVSDAFKLANRISDSTNAGIGDNAQIDEIITHNLDVCDSILSKYQRILNSRHNNLFDNYTIEKLYSMFGSF